MPRGARSLPRRAGPTPATRASSAPAAIPLSSIRIGGGVDPAGDSSRYGDAGGGTAARRGRGHGVHPGGDHRHLRRGGRWSGPGGHQDLHHQGPESLGAGRGVDPQDAVRDGARRPRDPHQAGRQAPQHAHAGVRQPREPHPYRTRVHGHLLSPGGTAGPLPDPHRAGGPGDEVPPSAGLRAAQGVRGGDPGRARRLPAGASPSSSPPPHGKPACGCRWRAAPSTFIRSTRR